MSVKIRRVKRARFALLVVLVILLVLVFALSRPDLSSFAKRLESIREQLFGEERPRVALVKWFPFSEENALKEWEEKIFRGRVLYRVEKDLSTSFVHATSFSTASALYYKIRLDTKTRQPVISWKWHVEKFPEKSGPEALETTSSDDFAARIYVIFSARFFTHTRVIEYVWTESLPVGQTGISPYSKNIRLMVLKCGKPSEDLLCGEERAIIDDYVTLFGERPRLDVGAIAFMTDADTTGTTADALYTDIKLGYKDQVLISDKKGTP